MNTTLYLLGVGLLFLLGLRLSAFFSGAETGFYRVSFLRVNIDAQAGDGIASRLIWFLQNPSYFVATCLVGNNVANYVTTLAVGLSVSRLMPSQSGWGEVIATLLISPVVFVCGELLPKNLYFRSPMKLLRKDTTLFRLFYLMFLPVSFPLIALTKLFEQFAADGERPIGHALGRNRLAQVLSMGHREGILVDVQNRMITGLMKIAHEQVTAGMTPAARIIGIDDSAGRDEVLETARAYGTSYVCIRRAGEENNWYGYVRTIDALLAAGPIASLIVTVPRFRAGHNRQEALLAMHEASCRIGIVEDDDGQTIGIVYEQGLIDSLLRA